jgi:hypothetical protein
VDGALLLARRGLPREHPHPVAYAVEVRRPGEAAPPTP